MKTINVNDVSLEACVNEAQQERVVVLKNGVPIAVVVGVQGLDADDVDLASSDEFWNLIGERRRQPTLTRTELEQRLGN